MLQVRIANIDRTYVGVFNTESRYTAVQQALAALIVDHGFFKENRVHEMSSLPDEAYGIVLLEGDDPEEEAENENTYLIFVSPLQIGKMTAC